MASTILKSLQFARLLNRLSFTSSKLYYLNSSRVIRSLGYTRTNKAYYATIAHKQLSSDESVTNDNVASSSSQSTNPVDDALSKIDSIVRQNGRVQMKHVANTFSMITSKEMTTSIHGLYLLRSCKFCVDEPPSKRVELMNQIWNKYQELGIQFDVKHYNTLLDIHISYGVAFNPVEILNSMEENGLEPNRNTYMLVMKKYCEDGNINGASEILEHMKEKGIPANEEVFNNLIQGHLKNKDISGANDILEVMKSSNLNPTADTYGILACGYAASGNKDEMMLYLNKMPESESSIQNHLKVIDVLASSGNEQYIDDVLSSMMHKRIFQQELLNFAIELIHKDLNDVAFKMITTFLPQYEHSYYIFIKQLVKTGKPLSEVLEYCSKICSRFGEVIFQAALRTAVECGKFECIIPIFKKMESFGHCIRPSSFWSLFALFKDEKSQDGIWIILKQMVELGVPADFATYCDTIFPVLDDLHPSNVIHNVKRTGQGTETAADALFLYLCNTGRIDYAHHLIEITHIFVSERINVEAFVNLYGSLNKNVIDKYLKVLKYMFMDENYIVEYEEFRGKLLAQIISSKPRLLEVLLEHFKDLKFNDRILQFCSQILNQKNIYRREHQAALRKLSVMSSQRDIMFKENLTVEEENNELKYLQSQNLSCKTFLISRLNHHIKTKDLNRISELLLIYDELNLPYSPLLLSKLTALYCIASDVEKATVLYNKLKTEFPTFKLDLVKALDYVTLLIKYDKLDESIKVMKNITEPYVYVNKDNVMKKIASLNIAVANSNNTEFAKTMQNLMLPLCTEFKTNKALLNSVLQLHLQRNEFSAAFEEFKNSLKTHRNPLGLNIFLKKCISLGEKDILQKVIDLTISCVSESYALLELSLAFIENRNYEKAAAVVLSLGQGAHPKDVEDLCVRLISQNKLTELEHFLTITTNLNLSNREALYCFAFKAYANKSNYDKVIHLYNELKKEIGEPSNKTLNLIQELFVSRNQPIPLAVLSKDFTEGSQSPHEATKDFIAYLEAGNAEAALKELGELKKGYIRTLSLKTLTDLVDLCLQHNCINDLSCNVQTMSYIIDNAKDVLRPVLEKYSAAGDVDKFINIARFFPDFSLLNVGFNNFFCQAFISSGKQEELLVQLEQRADKKNKMFSYAAFEELAKSPEFESRIFDLAVKYYDANFFSPMSVLWALHFSKENFDMANKIFKSFTITVDKADNIILRTIKQNENVSLAKEYINAIKSLNVRNRVKERAYGTALDTLVLKGMYDDAVTLALEAEQLGLQLNKYYLSTLVTLKNVLEKENKPVPFHLPPDALSSSSSDSE